MRHRFESLSFSGRFMTLKVGGSTYRIDLSTFPNRLLDAKKVERERYDVSPSGYGIHWPLLDEDLSVDGLIRDSAKPREKPTMRRGRATGKTVGALGKLSLPVGVDIKIKAH